MTDSWMVKRQEAYERRLDALQPVLDLGLDNCGSPSRAEQIASLRSRGWLDAVAVEVVLRELRLAIEMTGGRVVCEVPGADEVTRYVVAEWPGGRFAFVDVDLLECEGLRLWELRKQFSETVAEVLVNFGRAVVTEVELAEVLWTVS